MLRCRDRGRTDDRQRHLKSRQQTQIRTHTTIVKNSRVRTDLVWLPELRRTPRHHRRACHPRHRVHRRHPQLALNCWPKPRTSCLMKKSWPCSNRMKKSWPCLTRTKNRQPTASLLSLAWPKPGGWVCCCKHQSDKSGQLYKNANQQCAQIATNQTNETDIPLASQICAQCLFGAIVCQ